MFATNKQFDYRAKGSDRLFYLEGGIKDYEFAWQALYPIDQLLRETVPVCMGREKVGGTKE